MPYLMIPFPVTEADRFRDRFVVMNKLTPDGCPEQPHQAEPRDLVISRVSCFAATVPSQARDASGATLARII
jgi:hypothetical protein